VETVICACAHTVVPELDIRQKKSTFLERKKERKIGLGDVRFVGPQNGEGFRNACCLLGRGGGYRGKEGNHVGVGGERSTPILVEGKGVK